MPKSLVFLRANTLNVEPRLLKELAIAEQAGFSCHLLLWDRVHVGEQDSRATYLRLSAPFGSIKVLLFYPIWFGFCFWQLLKQRPTLIQACNVESALPALLASAFTGSRVIYDMWDSASTFFPLPIPGFARLMLALDRFLMRHSAATFVPDPDRFTQLRLPKAAILPKYQVIYNSDEVTAQKKTINLSKQDPIKICYIGVMSKKIRGLEQIISIAKHNPRFQFDIAGYGPDAGYINQLISEQALANLKFHGQLDRAQAQQLNQASDLVISLLDPTFENYKFATSSKIFEAFRFAKPVITTKGTASGRLVERAGWGVAIPYTPTALQTVLTKIEEGRLEFHLDPQKVQGFSWPVMAKQITETYELLSESPTRGLQNRS